MGQQKSKIISGEPDSTKNSKKSKAKKVIKKKAEDKKTIKKAVKKNKTRSKYYLKAKKNLKIRTTKSAEKAIDLIKKISTNSFNPSFEAHIALNLKPKEIVNIQNVKIDKGGVIHLKIGKTTDKTEKLVKNYQDLLNNILKARPSGKKDFIKSIAVCSTMSPSIKIKI